jgi:hypothetical protein
MPPATQFFEETFRPAKLLIEVYRLLENDGVQTDNDWIKQLRVLVGASADEEVMLLWNGVFLGLVMEAASVRKSSLRRDVLKNLLRQSVVCACTAMETYLQVLLDEHLTDVIRLRGYDLWPKGDKEAIEYFRDFNLGLEGALRLIVGDSDPFAMLARSLLGYFKYKNLGSDKAVKTAGMMLGLEAPWKMISQHLGRDEADLINSIRTTFKRRNDIVHRGDRELGQEASPRQNLNYEWTKHAVETVENVCLSLGELTAKRLAELKFLQASDSAEEASIR